MTSTDFYPTDTKAVPAKIRRSAERLQSISGVLLGHGEDVGSVLSQVALSFSEIIAPAIAAQIGTNLAALETAVEGTQYGYAVGCYWAADVEAFIAARNELIARWEIAEMEDFGVPLLNLVPAQDEEDVEQLRLEHRVAVDDARREALDGFVLEGHALWEAFQEKAIDRGRMFREGPTAENLALVVSFLGWGAMTLWPEFAPAPVSAADGVAAGTTVVAGLDGGAGPQAVVDALADVAAITRRAEAGQELTAAEIDFLEAFYATMGVRVLDVPAYLASNSGPSMYDEATPPRYVPPIPFNGSPELVAALSTATANGLLVLSRPTARTQDDSHDGYDRLPAWMRDTLAIEDNDPDKSPYVHFERLTDLGDLLGHSTVEAGPGLSRELAESVGWMIDYANYREDSLSSEAEDSMRAQIAASAPHLLTVVGRNDEVCFDLLTGSGMPDGYSPSEYFTDIYTFDWAFDDGAAAASLTDFIPLWATSGEPIYEVRASDAMSNVFGIVTGDGTFQQLMDGVGFSGDAASSSLGQVNPEISAGLGSLMTSYLDEFGMPEGNGGALGDLPIEDRIRYTTLVMTAPVAGDDLVKAISEHTSDQLSGVTDTVTAAELGVQAGRLMGLVDAGAVNVVMDQLGDQLQGVEDEDERNSIITSVVDVTLGRLPGLGGAVVEVLGTLTLSDAGEEFTWPDLDAGVSSDSQRGYEVMAGLVQQLSEQGLLLESIDPSLLDDSGSIRDFDELNAGDGDAARARLELLVEQALGLPPGDLLNELDVGYQEVTGQLPQSPEVYENVIEE